MPKALLCEAPRPAQVESQLPSRARTIPRRMSLTRSQKIKFELLGIKRADRGGNAIFSFDARVELVQSRTRRSPETVYAHRNRTEGNQSFGSDWLPGAHILAPNTCRCVHLNEPVAVLVHLSLKRQHGALRSGPRMGAATDRGDGSRRAGQGALRSEQNREMTCGS
jgi:hypothetical protein